MSVYTQQEYWIALAERAIKTAAQTAVALIGVEQVGILALDWAQIGSVVATAVVLSVLTSIASGQVNGVGPSLVASEQITEHFDPGPGVPVTDPEQVEAVEDFPADGPIALPDDGEHAEVDLTPPPADYEPRH